MDYSLLNEEAKAAICDAYLLAKDQGCSAIEPPLLAAAIFVRHRRMAKTILHEKSVSVSRFQQEIIRQVDALPRTESPTPGISDHLNELLASCTDGTLPVTKESLFRALVTVLCPPRETESSEERHAGGEEPSGALALYARDLNALATQGKLPPVIGRNEEMDQVIKTLLRKNKSNPVLVGAAGTGKTAIAEGVAQRIIDGNVPPKAKSFHLYSLDLGLLVAGASAFGQFEERLKSLLAEAAADPDIVLFIDEIHTLIGTGSQSNMDAANILKPALARGDIKIIGATTDDEYRIIEADPAFERRLQKVRVDELSPEETMTVLQGLRQSLESFHDLTISEEAEKLAVELSQRYLTERHQPDKAIDVIDTAAASCIFAGRKHVCEDDVREVISKMAGIPIEKMNGNRARAMLELEDRLGEQVFGQDEAISAVSSVIRRNAVDLGDQTRPMGVFLFLGPTGVGKTELAKALADQVMDSRENIIRIDMSEYQQPHSVSRLFGAPPGYVGYGRGGQLTEAIRRKPYSVVLLDEIEKAHPRVFETFLQVFDDGRMTDGEGRVVSFRNAIIIMTSNIGTGGDANRRTPIGFGVTASDQAVTSTAMDSIKEYFAPEFINRLDRVIRFQPLNRDLLLRIARKQLDNLAQRLDANGHPTTFSDEVAEYVVNTDAHPDFGARPIRRVIEQRIITPITRLILERGPEEKFPIRVTVRDRDLVVE